MVINVSKKYIFIHISKTAGNSVASRLKAYYPRRMFWLPKAEFRMHDTAYQVRNKIGQNRFNEFYKFTFVRNPWDRLFSLYTFLCQKTLRPEKGEAWDQNEFKHMGFKHWLLDEAWWPPYEEPEIGTPHQKRDQSSWITESDGTCLMDFVGKVETLDQDFEQICRTIGVDYAPLPHVNPSKHTSYRDIYDAEMIQFVEKYHWRDIERFGYEF